MFKIPKALPIIIMNYILLPIIVMGFMPRLKSISRVKTSEIFSSSESFSSLEEYISHLRTNSDLPKGFKVGATRFKFTPLEVADKILPMNVTLITLDEPTSTFAAMFTSNKVPGGPIYVGRDRLKNSQFLQAVIVNNKISNVSPSNVKDRGAGDSEKICDGLAKCMGLPSGKHVFPSSTGIIGWRLPVTAIEARLPDAVQSLQSETMLPAALGITTTDRYAKLRRYDANSGKWSVVAIAKGAGMIEPNMATMLAYIVTDLAMSRTQLEESLKSAAQTSFNTISVDGDQSTSDTVLALSSNRVHATAEDIAEFQTGLSSLCVRLAEDIVRNGEGTQHVIKVAVTGCPSTLFARDLGRFVTNSNLVKCAIAGCDPNVGRIVGAIGSFLSKLGPDHDSKDYTEGLEVRMGGQVIFGEGAFKLDPTKEKLLSDYLFDCQLYPTELPEESRTYPPHSRCVQIDISLQSGEASANVIGSDLTKEYVEVNADYRS